MPDTATAPEPTISAIGNNLGFNFDQMVLAQRVQNAASQDQEINSSNTFLRNRRDTFATAVDTIQALHLSTTSLVLNAFIHATNMNTITADQTGQTENATSVTPIKQAVGDVLTTPAGVAAGQLAANVANNATNQSSVMAALADNMANMAAAFSTMQVQMVALTQAISVAASGTGSQAASSPTSR